MGKTDRPGSRRKGCGLGLTAYDFTVRAQDGQAVPLRRYAGKVLLLFNSATECGFTPQYDELEALYQQLRPRGLVLLDFPCNQFGNQAPGSDEEIRKFCTGRYHVTFPIFQKICVNGPDADPLFQWLKSQKGFAGFDRDHRLAPVLEKLLDAGRPGWRESPDIKWNFTKFLIDRNGTVAARFEPTAPMEEVAAKARALLA